jgi:hypothetical protein
VSLDDVKTFLSPGVGSVIDSANDDELIAMLDRAEAIIAARVGPLEPTVVTGEVHTGPGPLVLKQWPVVSVESVSSFYGGPVTDFQADLDAGVVYGYFSCTFRDTTVTYTAGREYLTPDLQAAVLELVKHLWSTQRVPGSRPYNPGGPDERTLAGVSTYLLPYRVQTLIEPYLLPRLA